MSGPGSPSSDAGLPPHIVATEAWLRDFVIGLDLCPFAAGPFRAGRVRISEARGGAVEEVLADLVGEADLLLEDAAATTLMVVPGDVLADFEEFLDVLAYAEDLFEQTGHGDELQLVGFHPDYVFGDADGAADPANATNRSPHPTFHLLRRDEVARAIAGHPDVEGIPMRNVALLRGRYPRTPTSGS